ncbi:hypothetical protein PTSG_07519 [Salpingoeca rosetta]|uniref:Uncharacterized protein n=1 Tax=Salpingoeca rosetta (strain ATCC 50818 / BSB-021) TaxID=946362 RepID=F2UH01_SALR5|nr:uncharacterized protein PTSG_07519 [Salpingoeca rosetta]EGD76400.1 hypothetical protein PTSG_07519 [Salpingoeca rosetta]|eukprot:XP_004991315.1 hypothetical protein PTSG_07519 [Salpingoeca rosetta]
MPTSSSSPSRPKLIAAGIDAGIIAEGGADHQGDGQAPAAASSPSPSTHGASGPRTRSRAQRGPRRTGVRHDAGDHDDDDDDEGDGDDHGAHPSSSSSSLPSSATPSGGAQVASRASGLLDPRDPQVDAAIFAFLLGVLTGHPLRLAITDNRGRSGVLALRRLRERYIRSGKDHVSRLRQQLSSTTWLPTDTVDTFMSRITDINSQLLAAGVSIPEDDLRTLVRNELPAEFDVAMRFMEREDPPPSLSKMTADLIQEERRLHHDVKKSSLSLAHACVLQLLLQLHVSLEEAGEVAAGDVKLRLLELCDAEAVLRSVVVLEPGPSLAGVDVCFSVGEEEKGVA